MAVITTAAVREPGAGSGAESQRDGRERGRRSVMLGQEAGRVARVVNPGESHQGGRAGAPVHVRRVIPDPVGGRQVAAAGRRVVPGRAAARSCSSSAPPSIHGSRLTRRGRIVVALVWAVLIAAAAFPLVQQSSGAGSDAAQTVSVPVEAGDTLWTVARAVDPEADPRPLVEAIIEVNGLRSGGDIHPGDTLLVPMGGG